MPAIGLSSEAIEAQGKRGQQRDRMTGEQTFDYEALAQDAMRGVVRTVLMRAAKSGLPGDHHFYISFDTRAPGVSLSKRLKEKYPHEMTIVLQHRFWDLSVTDDRFEVKLTFDGIPERLVVPFAAIKVFFDPSVRYGLQFEDADAVTGDGTLSALESDFITTEPRATTTRSSSPRKPRTRKPKVEKEAADSASATAPLKPTGTSGAHAAYASQNGGSDDGSKDRGEVRAEGTGAQIVSLDAFRKK
jgi:hypothetical protein